MIIERPLRREGMTLRSLSPADASGRYAHWFDRPEVIRFLETTKPQTIERLATYIARCNASVSELLLGIFVEETPYHVGNIKLGPIHARHRRASIGLLIGEPAFWGRGLARRAISLVADHAFTELGVEKLTAGCSALNWGSRRAFAAAGFMEEATLRRHLRLADGIWDDAVLMCRLADKTA